VLDEGASSPRAQFAEQIARRAALDRRCDEVDVCMFVCLSACPVSLSVSLSYYSKTSLTRTSGDHPWTSVLTEVRVIRKLKKSKLQYINYAHWKRNANYRHHRHRYYAMRQQSSNIHIEFTICFDRQ